MIEVINYFDTACNFCIAIMWAMRDYTGLTYGTINVLLFIILGPISTILYGISALCGIIKKYSKLSKFLFALATLIVLAVCGVILYTAIIAITSGKITI